MQAQRRFAFVFFLGGLLSTALLPDLAQSRPLRIIHTNDLHSHLDHARDRGRGSYAAVKATIDQLKWESTQQGVDTLVLDGGDFTEDSSYYLAGKGLESWRAMGAMGYDAVTLGNHDWLAGSKDLDDVVGRAAPPFALLGANFIFTWDQKNLVKHMRQYVEFKKAGARIAVYGLTTDDWEYSWMAEPGFVHNPIYTAQEDLPALRSRNDYVIALTHLGVSTDKFLAQNTREIDLIVGGHSHTTLKEFKTAKNRDGKLIPIVQSGMHGEHVGDLLVDVEPGKPLQVLSYRLVEVYSSGPQDAAMVKVAQHAREALDREFGAEWLREVIGTAEVPLENAYYKEKDTAWSSFVADAIRETGKADAAVDATQFEGMDQPAGPITREQLFILYPRVFEFSKPRGWTVWTTSIKGWVLKIALQKVISDGMPILTSGITYDVTPSGGANNFRINGQPIVGTRSYKIAMPEGILRGAFGLSKALKIVFSKAHDTGVSIWEATEKKLRREGVIKALSPSRQAGN